MWSGRLVGSGELLAGWVASGSKVRACTRGSPPPTQLEQDESSVRGKGTGPKTTNQLELK